MIWIDSSFAIEWLAGVGRAQRFDPVRGEVLAILPMQFVEVMVFFLKEGLEAQAISQQMGGVELKNPEKVDLELAALLYREARKVGSKASLTDALLAAVARRRGERVLAFDSDFGDLGLKRTGLVWNP